MNKNIRRQPSKSCLRKTAFLLSSGLQDAFKSGVSDVREILTRIESPDLRSTGEAFGFRDENQRDENIIRRYITTKDKWKPFIPIDVTSIMLSFVLEFMYACAMDIHDCAISMSKELGIPKFITDDDNQFWSKVYKDSKNRIAAHYQVIEKVFASDMLCKRYIVI